MKASVTKKEYEAIKNLGFIMVKELAKEKTITGMSQEDIDTYEEKFDTSISSEKGKWGKFRVAKNNSVTNNKISIEINEDCVVDIINELYNPIIMSVIKCTITIVKTMNTLIKKLESKYDKISNKWFSDSTEE